MSRITRISLHARPNNEGIFARVVWAEGHTADTVLPGVAAGDWTAARIATERTFQLSAGRWTGLWRRIWRAS